MVAAAALASADAAAPQVVQLAMPLRAGERERASRLLESLVAAEVVCRDQVAEGFLRLMR